MILGKAECYMMATMKAVQISFSFVVAQYQPCSLHPTR